MVPFGAPYTKDGSNLASIIWGSPYSWELPCQMDTLARDVLVYYELPMNSYRFGGGRADSAYVRPT